MSDDITSTSVDGMVDRTVKPQSLSPEKYKKNFQGDNVASQANPLSDTEPSSVKSWTLAEIERVVSSEVMPTSKVKLAQFGVELARKNDFRLRDLSRRLSTQLRRDFIKEVTAGPVSRRLRTFDIQSQTMRTISANAALGSYQFQRTQVLPYMRKSLALSYEKTNLLKRVVGALGNLERALLIKLEAIKLNTAASVPRNPSIIKRIRNAIRDKNVDRIAGNFSNLIMSRYDESYRKHISPIFARLHAKMTDTSPRGGVNGVKNSVTRKINDLRHTVNQLANKDPKLMTMIERIQHRAAQMASGVLGATVKTSQGIKIPAAANSIISKPLVAATSFLDRIQPFAPPGTPLKPANPGGPHEPVTGLEALEMRRETEMEKFIRTFKDWHVETQHYQHDLLGHVTAIRQTVVPTKTLRPKGDKKKAKLVDKVEVAPSLPPKKTSIGSKLRLPFFNKPSFKAITDRFRKITTKAPKPTAPAAIKVPSVRASVAPQMPWHRPAMTVAVHPTIVPPHGNLLSSLTSSMGDHLKKIHHSVLDAGQKIKDVKKAQKEADRTIRQPTVQATIHAKAFGLTDLDHPTPSRPVVSPVLTGTPSTRRFSFTHVALPPFSLPKLGRVAQPVAQATHPESQPKQGFFKSISQHLGDHLKKMHETSKSGTKTNAWLKKLSDHHQKLGEKISTAVTSMRKGSYEDQQADKARRRALMAGAGAVAVAGAHPAPPPVIANTGNSWLSSAAGIAGGAALGVGKKVLRGAWGGLRGVKNAGKSEAQIAEEAAARSKRLLPRLTRVGWRASKGLTKIGVKGTLGATRLGGRTAWAAGKIAAKLGVKSGIGAAALGGRALMGTARRIPLLGLGLEGLDYLTGDKKLNWRNITKSAFALGGGALGGLLGGLVTGGMGGEFVGGVAGYAGGKALADRVFGDDAKTNASSSKRTSQRQQVANARKEGVFDGIKRGFQKFFFGDKFSNGEYKEGTSVISMVKTSIGDTLTRFGRALKALPGQIAAGVVSASKWTRDAVVSGAKATANYVAKKADQVKRLATGAATTVAGVARSAYNNLSWKGVLSAAETAGTYAGYVTSPVNFGIGASNAILGWSSDSGQIDNPTSPFYAYGTLVLNAYGIKNRAMFKFVHSLELSQDKINTQQIKPFDDHDMAYMAGRFGLDAKNKDAVNYFKLWYKRRFLPAMAIIGKVLKNHKQTFGGALGATDKEISVINDDLKKEIASSDLKAVGLEPSPQAYNKYARIGAADPGGASAATSVKTKPFDPRDPKNRSNTNDIGGSKGNSLGFSWNTGQANVIGGSAGMGPQKASRNTAQRVKGGVKEQPEYKAAYQKLPINIKKIVDKSKSLQFVLWSTSVQHGADTAVQIFQRDYSDKLDEKGYIHSIYQDRSTRFANLGSDDRTEAISHLGEEERFTMGIQSGSAHPDMNAAMGQVTNMVNPSGNSNLSYDSSSLKASPVTGDSASRAKDAIRYLMTKKYTKTAAVGIVANLLMESGLRTNAVGDSGRAHGIAQWHPDRRNKIYQQFRKGIEAMNLHEQLDAVDWEIKSGAGVTGGKNLFGDLNASRDVGQAVAQMVDRYERPADRQGNKIARTKIALGLLKTVGTDGADIGQQPKPPATKAAPAPAKAPAAAAKPTATKTASTPAPASSSPNANSAAMDNHAKELADHSAALREHAKALQKPTGDNAGTQNTIISPITQAASAVGGFISMSMKKAQVAVGEVG